MTLTHRLLVACLLVTCLPAAGWSLTPQEYLKVVRERHPQVVANADQAAAAQVAGCKALEVRGRVTGAMTAGERRLVQLTLADNRGFQVASTQPASELPLGAQVRVVVEPEPEHPTGYRLVAAAWESQVAPFDPKPVAAKPVEATAVAATVPPREQPYPSRGGEMDEERAILAAYTGAVQHFNRRLSEKEAMSIAANVIKNSREWGVDARLVMAMVACESSFNPKATSRTGAMGLGQLMPATARGLGVRNAYDPEQNLAGAIRLISGHLSNTGDIALALACYNAGSGAVKRYGGVPPYRETINYIRKVTELYYQLAPEMR